MSSKKEQKKEVISRSTFAEPPITTLNEENLAEYHDNFNKILEDTKVKIRKSI